MGGIYEKSEGEHGHAVTIDPASASAAAALESDPFYRSICGAYALDTVRRRAILKQYFSYSIEEGIDIGRCVHLPDRTRGVAVWVLPQAPEVHARAADNKRVFLETRGVEGCANYYRIVDFMKANASSLVDHDAWYLSIVAVNPTDQDQGLGRKLLEPTIVEADSVSATCYLETFTSRNLSFYQRLGFATMARFTEPTTVADYTVMVRYPRAPNRKGRPIKLR